jgi:hypothetical protein
MKWRVAAIIFAVLSAQAQGTFQNLNFEEADLGGYQETSLVPASAAFPGWQVSAPEIAYDNYSSGGALAAIVDDNPPYGSLVLDGNYSAYLFGGGLAPYLTSASLSQTGMVPPGTESIELDAAYFGAPFTVSLGSQTIDMVPLQSFVHYTLWGGNIPSSMAGQTETLTITEPPPSGTPPSELILDDISFSSTSAIPESSPLALTGLGGLLIALYRRFAPKRQ